MNIRSFALLFATLGFSAAFGAAKTGRHPDRVIRSGSYELRLSDEARGLAILAGDPVPTGCLVITEGRQFVLDTNIRQRLVHRIGQYDLDGEEVTLSFGTDLRLKGRLHEDGMIEIAGLRFVRHQSASVVGVWRVKGIDASMEFRDDATFSFRCVGARSAGTYRFDGSALILTWTSIDGEPVDADTVHKTLLVDDQGTFWIDNYHYTK